MRITARLALVSAALTAVAGFTVVAAPAQAQATRTWISGVGDDANPCSRTAPCKSWAGAISKTAAGGTINAIDSGGFGTLTITKSITIDGTGVLASALTQGTNGITINNPAADVVLRNIDLIGVGACDAGAATTAGVKVHAARSLVMEGVSISGYGTGVHVPLPAADQDLFVDVSLNDVTVARSCTAGISVDLHEGSKARLTLDRARITQSHQALVVGPGAEAWVKNSVLSLNDVAVVATGGAKVHSLCGNMLVGNATESTFTDVSPECAPQVVEVPVEVPVEVLVPARYCTVPALKKLTLAKAKARLVAAGCAAGKVTKQKVGRKAARRTLVGKVLTQDVRAGVKVAKGTKISLVLGRR